MTLKHFDELGEVRQRAAEAVDLVDHDDIDQSGLNIAQQPLERWSLKRASGDAAVIVVVGQRDPAFALWLAMYASPASR
jgi:hypothetical protein